MSVLAVSSERLGRPGSGQLLWAGFMTGGVIMRERLNGLTGPMPSGDMSGWTGPMSCGDVAGWVCPMLNGDMAGWVCPMSSMDVSA